MIDKFWIIEIRWNLSNFKKLMYKKRLLIFKKIMKAVKFN